MLGTNNDECKRKKTDVFLKLNKPCILREGVENSNNQSFLACIAAYNTTETCKKDCNIKSVKNDIKTMLTIDIFVNFKMVLLLKYFTIMIHIKKSIFLILKDYIIQIL